MPFAPQEDLIEERSGETDDLGEFHAWEVYGDVKRKPNHVRSSRVLGRFYADVVRRLRPMNVVEFGTAFGVSGMYFTAAMRQLGAGRLWTFEPNALWARLAEKNLAAVGGDFVLTVGTFEENVERITGPVDLALIDAVHTSEWVESQFDLVLDRCRSGAVVLIDDIDFSHDMRQCWKKLARDRRGRGSVAVAGHLGTSWSAESLLPPRAPGEQAPGPPVSSPSQRMPHVRKTRSNRGC
jgi:predicted O-methyltransferase YrrM